MIKIVAVAHLPADLVQPWLQHLRDFDVAHEGCRFEVTAEAPGMTSDQVRGWIDIDPPLSTMFTIRKDDANG